MENNYGYLQETQEPKGSLIGGVIGALIGAAIGAVAWAAVGMLGYIASVIGFVIAFLAEKGYDLLKGRQGTIKMIVLIICVILAVGAGTLGTAVWQIHNEYDALSVFEKQYAYPSEAEVIQLVLADEEVQSGLIKDSALGLVFGILGSIGLIKGAKNGKNKAAAAAAQPVSTADAIEMASVPAQNADADTDKENLA